VIILAFIICSNNEKKELKKERRKTKTADQKHDELFFPSFFLLSGKLESLLEHSWTHLCPLVLEHPELVTILHDISEHSTTKEHHVTTAGRILNAALELGKEFLPALEHTVKVELTDFLLKTRGKTGEHGGTTRKNDVLIELGTKIDISLLDTVKELISHTHSINIDEVGLEEHLRGEVTLLTKTDDTTVRDLEGIDEGGGLSGKLLLDGKIVANVAELLLDLTDSLKIGSAVEGITTEKKKLDEVAGNIRTGDIKTTHKVGHGVTLANGDDVSHTITRVKHDTIEKTLSIKHENGLHGNVDTVETVLLEHDLHHLLTILLGVHGSLSKKNLALLGVDLKALVPGVIPDVLHILPRADHTVIKRISDLKLRTGSGSLVTDHDILKGDAVDLLLRTEDGTADHGGESGGREVCTGKTSLHETGTVIANDSVLTSSSHY